jgi:sulfur carrier protein ThiS
MTSFLFTAFLLAIQPAPAWPALTTDIADALQEEGITQAMYARLRDGEILTARRATPEDKSGVRVAAFAVIGGTPEQIFEAVANCARLPEFMPHFVACTDVTPDKPLPPNERWNENHLSFGFFPLKFNIRIVQHAKLHPPHRLSWSRVSGDTKVNEGYWRIVVLGEGQNLLVYDTLSDPGAAVPDFVQRALTERDLPGTVEAVRKRIETRKSKGGSR